MSDSYFSIHLGDDIELPPEIDVKTTYGDISVDDFARQHIIGYLGLPLEREDEGDRWMIKIRLSNISSVTRLVQDLSAMEYGERMQIGDDEKDSDPGVIGLFTFRARQDDGE